LLMANPSVPANSLPELIAYAKDHPEKLAFATDGPRNFSGMIAAWINMAGTNAHSVFGDAAGHTERDRRPSATCCSCDTVAAAAHSVWRAEGSCDQHGLSRARL
jgi:hypothetical protein